nr:ribonuclease H-like domain-containing protein [Tanacetum cinerariifolium]
DNPHQTLEGKGIVDCGCSRHMTRNKVYLVDYQDFNGGSVAFEDSFLPNTFWAEAVSTACYVLNRVLVTKPQNKTPYELLTGKIPIISYIRPFGCHVTILNTIDHLGKFEEKSDERFLVGYSPITAKNKANKTSGPKEANNSAAKNGDKKLNEDAGSKANGEPVD